MSEFQAEIDESLRLLKGIEEGGMSAADAFNIADKRDEVIIYFVIRYLREKYPPSNPQSSGVTERLVEVTGTYDSIVAKSKKAQSDPVVEWFFDTYNLSDYFNDANGLFSMLVEKVEG